MDVIIWAIILGAIFYINKKSKSAGSKNTQPNKPRPQQKQMQQIWNSMQNTVQSGMNALNQTYQQKPQPQQRVQQPQRPQMQQRVQPQQRMAQEHSRNCQTLHTKAADGAKIIEAETQSMFGSVEDLIAMGYSGNLEFERDFLGEGLDMINNF